MVVIKDPSDCSGCSACANVCEHGAITMLPDTLGFLYPVVDHDKCIRCGKCISVCAFNGNYDTGLLLSEPIVYGARHKDMTNVEKSRSGAAFIALSDFILEHGGVVYGAGYADHFRVVHKRAASKEERDEFRGSKYVQSDMGRCFRKVKEDLKNGLTVLFSGTPCQTAGLNSYIGKKLRENLYLMDIVCHGVPSPYIWKDYIAYQEGKQGSEVTKADFRDKVKFGWKAHIETLTFGDREISTTIYTDIFYEHIMLRHSCSKCHYTNTRRPSDITIADFWGWEKTDPSFNADDKGCSLVLCNTEKGVSLFEKVQERMNTVSADLKNCMQPNLQRPVIFHPKRMKFEKDYQKKGFPYAAEKNGCMGWRYELKQLKWKVKCCIRQFKK